MVFLITYTLFKVPSTYQPKNLRPSVFVASTIIAPIIQLTIDHSGELPF
jgi:hypothetical protein